MRTLERAVVSGTLTAPLTVVLVQVLNLILDSYQAILASPSAIAVGVSSAGATLVIAAASNMSRNTRWLINAATAIVAAAVVAIADGAAGIPVAVVVAVLAAGVATHAIRGRLPDSVDGIARRRRTVTVLWALLIVLAGVQTARLSTWLVDPGYNWWHTTTHEFWSRHECMKAYIYAADLNRQGEENVYDPALYPALNPECESHATVANLEPDDPYQYPPQFLAVPRLALGLSNDYHVIHAFWFAAQLAIFLIVAVLLARWYGGARGERAAWLIPLLVVSVPAILNFQYGQFHITTIALALAGLMAFDRSRHALGGALLAAAILSKGFPGIVLLPMLVQRKWRPVLWTAGWAAALSLATLALIGFEPFRAFVEFHLPRMRTGAAFAFHEVWTNFRAELLAGNVSFYALVQKLGDLGLPGMTDRVARAVHGVFSISVVATALVAGRVRGSQAQMLTAMALLNVAAMTSPAAWGDYVPIGTLWMLTLLAPMAAEKAWARALVVSGWVFCVLLPGVVPIVVVPPVTLMLSLSVAGTLLLVALNGWVVRRAVTGAPV